MLYLCDPAYMLNVVKVFLLSFFFKVYKYFVP